MAKTRTFTDLDAVFASHPTTGDVSVRMDEKAIKFAVKSLILTSNFERPFHSEIGSPIRALLFENFGDSFEIVMREAVANVITNFEPRVSLIDVIVKPSFDNNSVFITVQFKIKNTSQPLDVSVTLERTR
jgi:phage baseplate assembly protein W